MPHGCKHVVFFVVWYFHLIFKLSLFGTSFWAAVRPYLQICGQICAEEFSLKQVLLISSSSDNRLALDFQTSKLSSQATVLCGAQPCSLINIQSFLLALSNFLHLPPRHIKEISDDLHFVLWADLRYIVRTVDTSELRSCESDFSFY